MEELLSFIQHYHGITVYLWIFGILLACGLGLPIPEDFTLFASGMLAFYGVVNVWWVIIVCLAGVLIGDSMIFWLGAKYGGEMAKHPHLSRWLPPERIENLKQKLHKNSDKLIFTARFTPILRAPTYFAAGALHLPFRKFFLYDGLAAMISVPTIIYLVYRFGEFGDKAINAITEFEHGVAFVIFSILLIMAVEWYLGHRKQNKP